MTSFWKRCRTRIRSSLGKYLPSVTIVSSTNSSTRLWIVFLITSSAGRLMDGFTLRCGPLGLSLVVSPPQTPTCSLNPSKETGPRFSSEDGSQRTDMKSATGTSHKSSFAGLPTYLKTPRYSRSTEENGEILTDRSSIFTRLSHRESLEATPRTTPKDLRDEPPKPSTSESRWE